MAGDDHPLASRSAVEIMELHEYSFVDFKAGPSLSRSDETLAVNEVLSPRA
ncbi:hypothetical protein N806_15325 [Rhodococcus sp. P27]|nr:hypothetical protein N806_15325 [Rhodococcus sp. P27]